jgi:hypothetical protein
MTMRVFITSGPNSWLDILRSEKGMLDPKFAVPCAPGLVCNPRIDYEHYNTPTGFHVVLARIALSDCLYTFLTAGIPGIESIMLEIGFALGQDKPVYIGADFDLASYAALWPAAAKKIFLGSPDQCWAQFVKEMAQ